MTVNYVEKFNTYTLGGNIADGQWNNQSSQLVFVQHPDTISGYAVVDLSEYLPDDEYQYEILLSCFVTAGTSAGDKSIMYVSSGTVSRSDIYSILTGSNNSIILNEQSGTGNGTRIGSASGIIPIKGDDKNLTVFVKGSTSSSDENEYYELWARGYRRVGSNNNSNSNLLEKIIVPTNTELTIGGNIFNGKWIYPQTHPIYTGNYTSNTTYTYDLKTLGFLPDDNYAYEVLLGGWVNTGTSSGDWVKMYVKSNKITNNVDLTAQNTREQGTGSNAWRNTILPLDTDGILKVYLNSTGTRDFGIYIYGYRRIGTNE